MCMSNIFVLRTTCSHSWMLAAASHPVESTRLTTNGRVSLVRPRSLTEATFHSGTRIMTISRLSETSHRSVVGTLRTRNSTRVMSVSVA